MEEKGYSAQSRLRETSDSIDRIKATGAESEEAGAKILASLQSQGASIQRSRRQLDDIEVRA